MPRARKIGKERKKKERETGESHQALKYTHAQKPHNTGFNTNVARIVHF